MTQTKVETKMFTFIDGYLGPARYLFGKYWPRKSFDAFVFRTQKFWMFFNYGQNFVRN